MKKQKFTIISLLLLACNSGLAEIQWLDRVVAVVGQQVITQNELNKEHKFIEHQLRSRNAKIPAGDALDRQIMERIVLKKLQLQTAAKRGIRIDEDTLEKAVRGIAQENGMEMTDFRRALQKEGLGFSEFRNNIREELTISSLRERQINQRVNVTEQEIDDLIKANVGGDKNREYFLSHILISVPGAASPDEIEKSKAEVTSIRNRALEGADFSQLAVAHSDGQKALEGGELGWKKSSQLPSIFAAEVKSLKVGEVSEPIRSPSGFHLVKLEKDRGGSEGPTTTESLSRHILIKADDGQQKLSELRQQIVDGADFERLAQKHSDDAGSGEKGGNLGWAFPGTFVPAFEKALASLKPGEMSQPFKSRFGWHIIELLDQRNATVPDEVLRQRAKQILTQQKQEEDLQLWLRRIRDEAFVEYRLPGMDPNES